MPSARKALGNLGTPIINIPGCPPNPHNFLTTVAWDITYGKVAGARCQKRPLFAYERLIHENCERRPHFDAGRFARVRRRGPPSRLVSLSRAARAGDLRQLLDHGVLRRGRRHLAGGH